MAGSVTLGCDELGGLALDDEVLHGEGIRAQHAVGEELMYSLNLEASCWHASVRDGLGTVVVLACFQPDGKPSHNILLGLFLLLGILPHRYNTETLGFGQLPS